MRFKTIFWLFNAVVLVSVLFIAFIPLIAWGGEYAGVFWGNIWVVGAVFLLFIAVLDGYFVRNWKLFTLLEKEDWPALLAWLEERIYGSRRIGRAYASLLVNTALSVSNLEAVRRLEAEVAERRPALKRQIGVILGIPVLLQRDPAAMEAYFGPLADDPGTKRREWALWCRALGRVSGGNAPGALDDLSPLFASKDAALRLLAVHLAAPLRAEMAPERAGAMDAALASLRADLAGEAGERRLARSREENLMAVVLSSLVNDARRELLEAAN